VAAVGIPTARSDHAVVCAKFARLIVNQMKLVCHDLEKTLGPSTAELDIRVGIHSGSCTAGGKIGLFGGKYVRRDARQKLTNLSSCYLKNTVLRGEKARFQLFGDVSDFIW
jgi:Adenylate and Guanylate cyclase catalytic domain